jgi:hypothetical protein
MECEWRTAEWNPQGEKDVGQTSQHMKGWDRDSMQRRNLMDEECFIRELWRKKKKDILDLRKTMYSLKNSFNNNTKFLASFYYIIKI